MWNNNIFHIAHISHYQPPPNSSLYVRPPGVPNEYQQHIYRAPCDCNTLGQMGEVSVRTMEDPSQRIVVCFFASNAERIATEKKNIYIPVFVPRSFCTATWCDHGEFNTLFLFLLLAVFLLPLLSCYNILYLFCSNPTTHRVNASLESFFVWTFYLSHTCNQNDTIHNNSRCGYPR